MYTRVLEDARVPMLDVDFVPALKRGAIDVVPAVVGFDGADVVLAGGRRVRPHVVVAATGFRKGLEHLVGHLGVLDPKGRPYPAAMTAAQSPDLYFMGFTTPLGGHLRQFGIDARRIARAIAGDSH